MVSLFNPHAGQERDRRSQIGSQKTGRFLDRKRIAVALLSNRTEQYPLCLPATGDLYGAGVSGLGR